MKRIVIRSISCLVFLLSISANAASTPPNVTSISPPIAQVGAVITVGGTGFNATPTKNLVMFTGNAVQIPSAASATSLTVTVPDNAESGHITVISNGVMGNPSTSKITIQPGVSSFSPTTIYAGQTLTITGYSFSATAQNNVVTFAGNVSATANSATTTTLTVIVPSGAESGSITVTTNNEKSIASSSTLTIECSGAVIQSMLNGGSTPLDVYNSCGKSTTGLYGSTYAGGLVAYLNTADGTGLIAAPTDYYYTSWGAFNLSVKGTQSGIGSGQQNTIKIIAAIGAPAGGSTYAAYLSKTENYNGFTDWFLPSIDELSEIVTNLNIVYANKTGTSEGAGCIYQDGHFVPYLVSGYWSSTALPQWNYKFATSFYECGMPRSENPAVLVRQYPSAVRLARYFTNQKEPVVTSFSPTTQLAGGHLTISGAGFSTTMTKNIVMFSGGAMAIPSSVTSSRITVTIPAEAVSGKIRIISNGIYSNFSQDSLTIQQP